MDSYNIVKKLVLYAATKQRLRDPEDVAARGESVLNLSATSRRLRRELVNEGVSPKLLRLSGDEIAEIVYNSISKYEKTTSEG